MDINKLNEVTAAAYGGITVLINKHTSMRILDGDVRRNATAEEYLQLLEQTSGKKPFADFGESRAIYKHIVKTNKLVEIYVHLSADLNSEYHYIVHYDFAMAVDVVWGLLELLGLVGEHAK